LLLLASVGADNGLTASCRLQGGLYGGVNGKHMSDTRRQIKFSSDLINGVYIDAKIDFLNINRPSAKEYPSAEDRLAA